MESILIFGFLHILMIFLLPKPTILWNFEKISNKNVQNAYFLGLTLLKIIKISKKYPFYLRTLYWISPSMSTWFINDPLTEKTLGESVGISDGEIFIRFKIRRETGGFRYPLPFSLKDIWIKFIIILLQHIFFSNMMC